MRLLLLLLAVAPPSLAQFWDLASTDDGSQLYFGSSLVLAGSSAASLDPALLYKMDQDGIHLISTHAMTPQVSGDGQVAGYTDTSFCTARPTPPSCVEAMLLGPPVADLETGDLHLSRNGRWALVSQVSSNSSLPPISSVLIDLVNGSRTPVPPRPADSIPFVVCRSIASDGTLLVQMTDSSGANSIALWQQGNLTAIPVSLPPYSGYEPLALSDDASTYFYAVHQGATRLVSRNLADGTETVLFTAPAPLIYFMGASRNGRTVLFRYGYLDEPGPAYVADSISGASARIPLDGNELVTDGTLSGSGGQAFLVTTTGRMVKVAVAGSMPGTIDEIIAPTPYLSEAIPRIFIPPVAPGNILRLWGVLDRPADFWNGAILFDGRPAAVLAAAGGEVDIQVPWDAPVGAPLFQLKVPSQGSPFEQNQQVYVNSAIPTFSGAYDGFLGLKFERGDWSGLLTTQPSPGDLIHLYMTGLGAVSDSPPLGQPAPVTQLFPLQGTLTCLFLPVTSPAQTLFVGLAPGMLGIYQIDFRMPDDLPTTPLNGIACTLNQLPYGDWRFAYCSGENCLAGVSYP